MNTSYFIFSVTLPTVNKANPVKAAGHGQAHGTGREVLIPAGIVNKAGLTEWLQEASFVVLTVII